MLAYSRHTNLPKKEIRVWNLKTNVAIRISILEIPCLAIFNFDFLGPNLPKNEFWHQNFKILSLDSESASLIYYVHQFSDKPDNFEYLDPNLPKNKFWGRNFKNLSLDSELAFLRYYVYQFSDKTDNFEFSSPNLPKNQFWSQNLKNLRLD